jgi:hypothetical protein
MPLPEVLILAGLIFVAAALCSSVGHAGASGYLAAMAFYGVAPQVMKPTALVLNILSRPSGRDSSFGPATFPGPSSGRSRVGSVPMAFLGGALQLPDTVYKIVVGLILPFAAAHLAWFMPDAQTDVRSCGGDDPLGQLV